MQDRVQNGRDSGIQVVKMQGNGGEVQDGGGRKGGNGSKVQGG